MTERVQKKNCQKKMCKLKVYDSKGFRNKSLKIIKELGGESKGHKNTEYKSFIHCKPEDDEYLTHDECLKLATPNKNRHKSPLHYRERTTSSRYKKITPPHYVPQNNFSVIPTYGIKVNEKIRDNKEHDRRAKKYDREQEELGNYSRSYRAPFDGLGGKKRNKTSKRYKKVMKRV